ncbi:recombinase family protein [Bradyrhizobium sp. URHD0069]|uniref:recombinase family protein n=1 Tax=Bradyrhizobium sp. URHD0069 TaxID=1380355 RepID=UPI0018CC591F
MSNELQSRGDSLRRQREASKKYAETHGLELVEDIDLHDIGVSAYAGKNIASGKFGQFLTAVRDGQIEKGSYLLVESFDRMSRQEPIVALQPFMDIVNSGLKLVTLDDERVFSGKISFEDLIISIAKMSRANEESARKSDRVAKAWKNKRDTAGTKKLTARCPSWLRLLDNRQGFGIVEDRARIVRRMFEEAVAGLGAFSIVRRLNDEGIQTFSGKAGWQTSTVNKIIGSKSVIGEFQPSRMINGKRKPEGDPIKGYFPRIIDDDKFYAAQRGRLERRTTGTADRKGSGGAKGKRFSNLFSKLAVCDNCGSPMQYENKGVPPKGQSYLVCSNAIRKHGCYVVARWRYDHFETMFLSFVERLDLASIVSVEQHNSKRNDLTRQLDTLAGREKMLQAEMEQTYSVLKEGGQTSEFLARKFADAESALSSVKANKADMQTELAALETTSLGYYTNQGHMSALIEKVRAHNGGDVYKIRSMIASRLQSLIKELRLTVAENIDDEQHFEVMFRDGSGMKLFVDPKNPLRFTQKVSGKGGEFELVTDDGRIIALPADAEAEDGY